MRRVERPRIVVTLSNPERASDPAVARQKNERYLRGGRARRRRADCARRCAPAGSARKPPWPPWTACVISGGADLDPTRYGEAVAGSRPPDTGTRRDRRRARSPPLGAPVPLLGVCRGCRRSTSSAAARCCSTSSRPRERAVSEPRRHAASQSRRRRDAAGRHRGRAGGAGRQLLPPPGGDARPPGPRARRHRHCRARRDEAGRRRSRRATRIVWLIGMQCHPERTESSPAGAGAAVERLRGRRAGAPQSRRSPRRLGSAHDIRTQRAGHRRRHPGLVVLGRRRCPAGRGPRAEPTSPARPKPPCRPTWRPGTTRSESAYDVLVEFDQGDRLARGLHRRSPAPLARWIPIGPPSSTGWRVMKPR